MNKGVSQLKKIHQYFQESDWEFEEYSVPNVWINQNSTSGFSSLGFREFYVLKLNEILKYDRDKPYHLSLSHIKNEHTGIGGDWSYFSVIYNAFPRFTTAFDHTTSGDLEDYKHQGKSIKKTGTFLKMIAMLPYIKSFGCNVLHLMPITKIGVDGKRGDLGSPYAIKNPYELDENLAETAIPFTVEEQFKALVEACHMMDIRVVVETALRTASLDHDWILEHPEWFYWIKKDKALQYQKPTFTKKELKQIKNIPTTNKGFVAPNIDYQAIFAQPPTKEQLSVKQNKITANTHEGELQIADAFADWPPDDAQPAWDDVTYFRLYNDEQSKESFNYIAYNTIRFYDPDLTHPKNRNTELWDALIGVIPYFQENYGIDGIMLDMGHALPKELLKSVIEEARKRDPDFGFWEENFEINKASRKIGFNASLGFEWDFNEFDVGIRNLLVTAVKPLPLPFFGTPETHNTPRIIDAKCKRQFWALNMLLPSCMPFIHAGYELNEKHPVNTGLKFTSKELAAYVDFPLPLFNRQAMDWAAENTEIDFMQKLALLRMKNQEWIATGDERTLHILYPENRFGKVIAFERNDAFQPWKTILVIMNVNHQQKEKFFLQHQGTYNNGYLEYLSGEIYTFEDHWLTAELTPGEILIFEIHKLLS